ncbi:MAG TPA: hypothetical protein VK718_06480 [Ferruginibacter sp.]|nr:hypothetical protein [Ferruginibacter sp.]
MKKTIQIFGMVASIAIILSACTKAKTVVSTPPLVIGNPVSDTGCLKGGIQGTMLAGKTYTICGDVTIPAGDTLLIQPGVTINVEDTAGFIVLGTLVSNGTQANPITFTADGAVKNNTPGLAIGSDNAHAGLWRGIQCGASCPLLLLRWTHIDFAGASEDAAMAAAVNETTGTSFNILFENVNGSFIMEDSWVYGGTDDCIRVSNGKVHVFRNTFEKCGGVGGDCVNMKGGTVGTVAYNFFIGTAYNGQKVSNKGQPVGAPEANVVMYNSTFVNDGTEVVAGQRGSTIDYEQGAEGSFHNNVSINCVVGYRVVSNPAADTLNLSYGNNYQWGDDTTITDQFFTFGPVCTIPQTTDLPLPSSYLPISFNHDNVVPFTNTAAVQQLNPMFVNYPLPNVASHQTATLVTSIQPGYNFHLQSGSPLIGKGTTNITPLTVVTLDPKFGAITVTPPSADLGCYPFTGSGNNH